MSNLQQEFDYYLANQNALVKKYNGKFIVIKDKQVQGAYETELDAYKAASEKFEAGTFLIQPCLPGAESHTQTFYSRVAV